MQVRGFAPFQIKSEWFGGNEYCRKDFSYDAVNGQQNAKNKHKQSDTMYLPDNIRKTTNRNAIKPVMADYILIIK